MSDLDLEALEATARAALPREWDEHQQWRDEYGFNNGGCPSRFFYIPQHNGGAKVEMLAEVSEHIVAFQPATALKLIADAKRLRDLRAYLLHTLSNCEGLGDVAWTNAEVLEMVNQLLSLGWSPAAKEGKAT